MDKNSSYYKAFYKPRNTSFSVSRIVRVNANRVKGHCLNDNQVIKIIYNLGNKLFGTDLDVVNNPNYPQEIKVFLDTLHREIPGAMPAPDAETAFRFIRDRYAQCGGELDEFVVKMANEYNAMMQESSNENNSK